MSPDLHSIVPPLVTPFDAGEQVDETAVAEEVRYHLAAGVDGICVCGSTGDGQMLAPEEATTPPPSTSTTDCCPSGAPSTAPT